MIGRTELSRAMTTADYGTSKGAEEKKKEEDATAREWTVTRELEADLNLPGEFLYFFSAQPPPDPGICIAGVLAKHVITTTRAR